MLFTSNSSSKSSLLGAILGEIPKVSGTVNVSGTMAYVAQQPWIQNTTLRENILFGKAYNQKKYEEVLKYTFVLEFFSFLGYAS